MNYAYLIGSFLVSLLALLPLYLLYNHLILNKRKLILIMLCEILCVFLILTISVLLLASFFEIIIY